MRRIILVLAVSLVVAQCITQPEFDCTARIITMEHAFANLGPLSPLSSSLTSVYDALRLQVKLLLQTPIMRLFRTLTNPQLQECNQTRPRTNHRNRKRWDHTDDVPNSLYVATNGSDALGDGSMTQPFATLHRARDAARTVVGRTVVFVMGGRYRMGKHNLNTHPGACANRTLGLTSNPDDIATVTVPFLGTFGRYEMESQLTLTTEDSGLTIEACDCRPGSNHSRNRNRNHDHNHTW